MKVEGQFALSLGEAADFGEVPVTAEEDGGNVAGFREELEKTGPFVGQIAPFLEAMGSGEDLNGADNEAEFGGLFQLGFQPIPLGLAKHGGVGTGLREVGRTTVDFLFRELASESAGVEHDDLHALSNGSKNFGMIDPRSFAGFVIRRKVEGVEKEAGRGLFHGEFTPGIVLAIIVIVPDWQNGHCFRKGGVVRQGNKALVFFLHHLGIVGVGVNVVSHEEEGLWLLGSDHSPNPVVPFRLVTRSTGDSGDGLLGEGWENE